MTESNTPLQLASSLEGTKDRIQELPQNHELRQFFDEKWEELDAHRDWKNADGLKKAELPKNWKDGEKKAKEWVEADSPGRIQKIVDVAKAYVRREKGKDLSPKELVALEVSKNELGESFDNLVELGFRTWAELDIEEMNNSIGDEIVQNREGEIDWEKSGWREEWGDSPTFTEEKLTEELQTLLTISRNVSRLSYVDGEKTIQKIDQRISRILEDSRIKNKQEVDVFVKHTIKIKNMIAEILEVDTKPIEVSVGWEEESFGERPYKKLPNGEFELDEGGNQIPLLSQGAEKFLKEFRVIKKQYSNNSSGRTINNRLMGKLDRLEERFRQSAIENFNPVDISLFNSEFIDFYLETSRSMEQNDRVGTLEAFFNFAIDKKGGAWTIDRGNEKAIEDMNSKERKDFIEGLVNKPEDSPIEFKSFKAWTRNWMMGELDDTMRTNENSMVSGLTQIDAPLLVMGLENNVPIISILGRMNSSILEWGDFVKETVGQLNSMAALHNRERLYARAKNISPEEVTKTLAGISEQGAGRTESLAMTGEMWSALLLDSPVSQKENMDGWGETFRKAMGIYLSADTYYLDGRITVEKLGESGISVPSELVESSEEVVDNDGNVVHVVVDNIFPLEIGSEDFTRKQRQKMVKILTKSSGSEHAASLAENLAYKAMEFGMVGADLDTKRSGIEAMYKLMHTRPYRDKYIKASKPAGNPLTLDDIDRLAMPYFDMIKLPLNDEGNSTNTTASFRKWILGANEGGRVPSQEIPVKKMVNRPDYYYYDGVVQWGTQTWGYLMNGFGVSWENVAKPGSGQDSRGMEINPEHTLNLQNAYKYLGYWVGGLSKEEIQSFIMPFDEREDAPVNVLAARSNLPEGHTRHMKLSEYKTEMTKLIFRRLIYRDLQQFGEKYNKAISNMNPLKSVIGGRRLDTNDLEMIHRLLVEEVGKLHLVENDLYGNSDESMSPLFTQEMVMKMFFDAGLTTWKATWKNLGDLAERVSQKWGLKEKGGR